jgi:hypothetical protein
MDVLVLWMQMRSSMNRKESHFWHVLTKRSAATSLVYANILWNAMLRSSRRLYYFLRCVELKEAVS